MSPSVTAWSRRLIGIAVAWIIAGRLLPNGAPLGIVATGAVLGSVTALTAVGLILVYRAARVVNFAHAPLGGVGGLVAVTLHVEHGWNYAICTLVAVVVSGGIGAAAEAAIMRRFTNSKRLTATVATVGLAQLFAGVQLLVPRLLGSDRVVLGGFDAPIDFIVHLGPAVLTGNHLAALLVTPAIAGVLSWALLRTDVGLALRGAAENRERALLFGIPVTHISTAVWAIAGALSAVTFVVEAPFAGVTPDVGIGPTILLAGLAASVLAGMESLRVACAAAIGLGILEQVVLWNSSVPALVDVLLLGVTLAGLIARRHRLGRSDFAVDGPSRRPRRRLPTAARRPLAVVAVAIAAAAPVVAGPSTVNLMSVGLVWAAVGVSVVVLTGWAGQVSLGQFAIAGAGAFAAGNAIQHVGVDLFVALLLGGAAGAATALLLGVPALRITGPFLGVTTLGFAVVADSYLLNPTYVGEWVPQQLPERPVLWQRFPLESETAMYEVCLAFLFFVAVAVHRLRRRQPGRILIAVRDNVAAAEAVGIASAATRLSAFVIAGIVAGVAGGLHVVLLHGASVGTYQPAQSLQLLSMVVIGGVESVLGALLGVGTLRLVAGLAPEYGLLVTGVGVLVVLLLAPGGLLHFVPARSRRRRRDAGHDAARPQSDSGSLLSCRSVEAWYGPTQVLFGTDLDVREGEVVALLGTNGAGKSTLLSAIAGLLPRSEGSVLFGGHELRTDPRAVASAGVALMPGGRSVFPSLTAEENLRLAGWLTRRRGDFRGQMREVLRRFPALHPLLARRAGDLSGGEQQMLSMAQALLARPSLLLVDELTLGLSPRAAADLLEVVRGLAAEGTAVVVVEQSLQRAAAVADHAVVLEKGEIRFAGSPSDLLDRTDLARSVFFGASRPRPSESAVRVDTAAALRCRRVSKHFGGVCALGAVDISVLAGEIVGLIGPNGAGKTTLLDCISGVTSPDEGTVMLGDRDVTSLPPWRRARAGLGRSFQHARLYPSLTVAECLAVALGRHVRSRDPIAAAFNMPASYDSELELGSRVDEILDVTGLNRYRNHLITELSTGTRRIVDLACALGHNPTVLLLDEPTAGIAQREAEMLAPHLIELRDRLSCSIVVVEHDIAFVTAVADRLIALDCGGIVCEGKPEAVLSDDEVIATYTGRASRSVTVTDQ